MIVSVFIGTSVDGFIARRNGSYDFLPEGGGEPHGYDEFMASVDTLVIGRKTFETVLALPGYGGMRFNRWQGLQRGLLPPWLRKAPNMSTSTEELRFKDSCAMDSFNDSSFRGYRCLSERESHSLAHCRKMCGYVTWGRSSIRAAWLKASIRSFPNEQKTPVLFRSTNPSIPDAEP